MMSRSARLMGRVDDIADRFNELARTEGMTQWIAFLYGQGNDIVNKNDDETIALINKFGHEVRPKLN